MRSLYVRIILTFLLIVLLSMGISYAMANLLFRKDNSAFLEERLSASVRSIERLYAVSSPWSLPMFLQETADMQGLSIVAVSARGQYVAAGPRSDAMLAAMTADELRAVFAGRTIKLGREAVSPESAAPFAIGRPARLGGSEWAVFLQPSFQPEVRSFQRNTYSILFTLLIVGGILIVVVTRYLVKPLKMMTAATTRIAKGDYSTRLPVHRRDELGELADSINRMALGLSRQEAMRQDFVSNVSHEIQSPLTSIGGFAEALRSGDLSAEERDHYVSVIKQESSRLSRLSENLLKLASLDAKQHPFEPRRYRLDRQLRDVVLTFEPQWLEKRLTVELTMEETTITADEDQLNQIWVILLANAMKFTPEGGKISFYLTEKDGYALVRITDTGIGISEEDRERIFERFYKADKSRDWNVGGSGLGLSIAKKIVENHDGTIEAEPSERGASFAVRLPIAHLGQ
ncbi:sensor histidine kinase [Paenibacillus thailandensis]|uniref:Heme sensor protein HssS n=1 Tax=Paenibacillus thailandensis TaxID=393250 RepID=A0ABW5R153_9BACL